MKITIDTIIQEFSGKPVMTIDKQPTPSEEATLKPLTVREAFSIVMSAPRQDHDFATQMKKFKLGVKVQLTEPDFDIEELVFLHQSVAEHFKSPVVTGRVDEVINAK